MHPGIQQRRNLEPIHHEGGQLVVIEFKLSKKALQLLVAGLGHSPSTKT
jgi:hypothetical protein